MIYSIADLRIDIKNKYSFTDRYCDGYQSEDQHSAADVVACVTDNDLALEREASPGFSEGYIENICLYRSICSQIPLFDRMLLHAAVLRYDDSAYAFLGRSGAGKSTHTGLWLQYIAGASILNGDKPILSFNGDLVFAHGTPWMGKEARGANEKAPLKGLCFIKQPKENSIRRLSTSEAVTYLIHQVLIPDDEAAAEKTLECLDKLVTLLPIFELSCDISEEAVKLSFEALTKKKYHE